MTDRKPAGHWFGQATAYSSLQRLMGADGVRRRLLDEYVRPVEGERMLDLGCGPGDVVGLLPGVQYTGIDINPRYIDAARRRFGAKARFLCGDVRELPVDSFGRFEAVIAIGVIHHLEDDEALALSASAAALLTQRGRFVTLDPGLVAGQSGIARWLARRDRGTMVRTPEAYRSLAAPHFASVDAFVHHDLARVPYTHVVLVARHVAETSRT